MADKVSQDNIGDHGKFLMQCIKFDLLRIKENAHLTSSFKRSGASGANRFGITYFVDFNQLRGTFNGLFRQLIMPTDGKEEAVNQLRPIVVLGHAVYHDIKNLKEKEAKINLHDYHTVVAIIDTQRLAFEAGLTRAKQIGLKSLVAQLGFQHTDAHTAANDVGRTIISAIQLALRVVTQGSPLGSRQFDRTSTTLQEVADDIEQHSRENHEPIGGDPIYCWRCRSIRHMGSHEDPIGACDASPGAITCSSCRRNTHLKFHCIEEANTKAEARRKHHLELSEAKKQKRRETYLSANLPPAQRPQQQMSSGSLIAISSRQNLPTSDSGVHHLPNAPPFSQAQTDVPPNPPVRPRVALPTRGYSRLPDFSRGAFGRGSNMRPSGFNDPPSRWVTPNTPLGITTDPRSPFFRGSQRGNPNTLWNTRFNALSWRREEKAGRGGSTEARGSQTGASGTTSSSTVGNRRKESSHGQNEKESENIREDNKSDKGKERRKRDKEQEDKKKK